METITNLLSLYCALFHPVDKSTDYQNFYQGLWDCEGDHPDELSFKRGDAIYIVSKVWLENPAYQRQNINLALEAFNLALEACFFFFFFLMCEKATNISNPVQSF